MREFRIAKGWAIFIYVCSPFLLGLFGWLLFIPFQGESVDSTVAWIFVPMSLGMISVILFGIIETFKGKITVLENGLRMHSTFYTREYSWDEIKGYRLNDQYLFVEPKQKGKKRIKISKYFGSFDELYALVSDRCIDLDEATYVDYREQALKNPALGSTEKERRERIQWTAKKAIVLNWYGGLSALYLFLYPKPYLVATLNVILIPIAAILMVRFSKGLLKLDENDRSNLPSLVYALIYPSLALLIRATTDYSLFAYTPIWSYVFGLSGLLMWLLLFMRENLGKMIKEFYVSLLSILLFFLVYSFGTLMILNCYFDETKPEVYTAPILEKRISKGKSTSYYLRLGKWGPQKEEEEVSVNSEKYNSVEVGEKVVIEFRKGLLDIPWIVVE